MAIKLDIKPYCEHCGEFEAETYNHSLYDADGTPYMVDIRIRCEHARKCIAIHDHLKKSED